MSEDISENEKHSPQGTVWGVAEDCQRVKNAQTEKEIMETGRVNPRVRKRGRLYANIWMIR